MPAVINPLASVSTPSTSVAVNQTTLTPSNKEVRVSGVNYEVTTPSQADKQNHFVTSQLEGEQQSLTPSKVQELLHAATKQPQATHTEAGAALTQQWVANASQGLDASQHIRHRRSAGTGTLGGADITEIKTYTERQLCELMLEQSPAFKAMMEKIAQKIAQKTGNTPLSCIDTGSSKGSAEGLMLSPDAGRKIEGFIRHQGQHVRIIKPFGIHLKNDDIRPIKFVAVSQNDSKKLYTLIFNDGMKNYQKADYVGARLESQPNPKRRFLPGTIVSSSASGVLIDRRATEKLRYLPYERDDTGFTYKDPAQLRMGNEEAIPINKVLMRSWGNQEIVFSNPIAGQNHTRADYVGAYVETINVPTADDA